MLWCGALRGITRAGDALQNPIEISYNTESTKPYKAQWNSTQPCGARAHPLDALQTHTGFLGALRSLLEPYGTPWRLMQRRGSARIF